MRTIAHYQLSTFGTAERPKTDEFRQLAKERAEEKKISLGQAMSEVGFEDPELREAVRQESIGEDRPSGSIASDYVEKIAALARAEGLSIEEAEEIFHQRNPAFGNSSRTLLSERGSRTRSNDASDQLRMAAHKRAAERNIPYSQALTEVSRDNPASTQIARRQVLSDR